MTVRGAVGGDAHALAALSRFVHELHLARRPDYFKPLRVEDAAAWFRARLDEATSAAWDRVGFERRALERRPPQRAGVSGSTR